ncbi:hypothetical protein IAD21_02866 [Abditibacteriota bacterium]|nr:hypothetical protein IAD21_02866 [Abditibacteriota bacterium]
MIMDRVYFALKLFSALGCGLMAGVFFAFSVFVMSGLGRLPASQGIAAMQSINITVINPVFMLVFMGTALSCLLLGIIALVRWNQPGSAFLLAGSLLYFVGTFLVTVVFNVPLNDALAVAKPNSAEGAKLWSSYLLVWTMWNHVRTLGALAATASFIMALLRAT